MNELATESIRAAVSVALTPGSGPQERAAAIKFLSQWASSEAAPHQAWTFFRSRLQEGSTSPGAEAYSTLTSEKVYYLQIVADALKIRPATAGVDASVSASASKVPQQFRDALIAALSAEDSPLLAGLVRQEGGSSLGSTDLSAAHSISSGAQGLAGTGSCSTGQSLESRYVCAHTETPVQAQLILIYVRLIAHDYPHRWSTPITQILERLSRAYYGQNVAAVTQGCDLLLSILIELENDVISDEISQRTGLERTLAMQVKDGLRLGDVNAVLRFLVQILDGSVFGLQEAAKSWWTRTASDVACESLRNSNWVNYARRAITVASHFTGWVDTPLILSEDYEFCLFCDGAFKQNHNGLKQAALAFCTGIAHKRMDCLQKICLLSTESNISNIIVDNMASLFKPRQPAAISASASSIDPSAVKDGSGSGSGFGSGFCSSSGFMLSPEYISSALLDNEEGDRALLEAVAVAINAVGLDVLEATEEAGKMMLSRLKEGAGDASAQELTARIPSQSTAPVPVKHSLQGCVRLGWKLALELLDPSVQVVASGSMPSAVVAHLAPFLDNFFRALKLLRAAPIMSEEMFQGLTGLTNENLKVSVVQALMACANRVQIPAPILARLDLDDFSLSSELLTPVGEEDLADPITAFFIARNQCLQVSKKALILAGCCDGLAIDFLNHLHSLAVTSATPQTSESETHLSNLGGNADHLGGNAELSQRSISELESALAMLNVCISSYSAYKHEASQPLISRSILLLKDWLNLCGPDLSRIPARRFEPADLSCASSSSNGSVTGHLRAGLFLTLGRLSACVKTHPAFAPAGSLDTSFAHAALLAFLSYRGLRSEDSSYVVAVATRELIRFCKYLTAVSTPGVLELFQKAMIDSGLLALQPLALSDKPVYVYRKIMSFELESQNPNAPQNQKGALCHATLAQNDGQVHDLRTPSHPLLLLNDELNLFELYGQILGPVDFKLRLLDHLRQRLYTLVALAETAKGSSAGSAENPSIPRSPHQLLRHDSECVFNASRILKAAGALLHRSFTAEAVEILETFIPMSEKLIDMFPSCGRLRAAVISFARKLSMAAGDATLLHIYHATPSHLNRALTAAPASASFDSPPPPSAPAQSAIGGSGLGGGGLSWAASVPNLSQPLTPGPNATGPSSFEGANSPIAASPPNALIQQLVRLIFALTNTLARQVWGCTGEMETAAVTAEHFALISSLIAHIAANHSDSVALTFLAAPAVLLQTPSQPPSLLPSSASAIPLHNNPVNNSAGDVRDVSALLEGYVAVYQMLVPSSAETERLRQSHEETLFMLQTVLAKKPQILPLLACARLPHQPLGNASPSLQSSPSFLAATAKLIASSHMSENIIASFVQALTAALALVLSAQIARANTDTKVDPKVESLTTLLPQEALQRILQPLAGETAALLHCLLQKVSAPLPHPADLTSLPHQHTQTQTQTQTQMQMQMQTQRQRLCEALTGLLRLSISGQTPNTKQVFAPTPVTDELKNLIQPFVVAAAHTFAGFFNTNPEAPFRAVAEAATFQQATQILQSWLLHASSS